MSTPTRVTRSKRHSVDGEVDSQSTPKKEKGESKLQLSYWKLRGLAQPIRYVLEYVKEPYEDKFYNMGPDGDRSEWLKEKHNLGFDFPNLPNIVCGDFKLTQSHAILVYLAAKHGLDGKNSHEDAVLEELAGLAGDIRPKLWKAAYGSNLSEELKNLHEALNEDLAPLDKFLNRKKFFGGKNISYVDFVFYDLLDMATLMIPDLLEKFHRLKQLVESIEKLPEIAKYRKSERFTSLAVVTPGATWKPSDGRIKLAYWKVHGLTQPIRYLLEFTEQPYEDKYYHLGPDMNRDEWLKEKFTLGFDFPNLPYLVDGDFKLTQSHAIIAYLAKKHGLAGKNAKEEAVFEELSGVAGDIRQKIGRTPYSQNLAEDLKTMETYLLEHLVPLESYLNRRKFFGGKTPCYVDFIFFQILDFSRTLLPNVLDNFSKLHAFMTSVEKLPQIARYRESERFRALPMFGPNVTWKPAAPKPANGTATTDAASSSSSSSKSADK